MQGWTFKTTAEKEEAKSSVAFNFLFKMVHPTPMVMHFEVTKNLLVHRMFTNDVISLPTLKDFYFSPEVARKALTKQI